MHKGPSQVTSTSDLAELIAKSGVNLEDVSVDEAIRYYAKMTELEWRRTSTMHNHAEPHRVPEGRRPQTTQDFIPNKRRLRQSVSLVSGTAQTRHPGSSSRFSNFRNLG
jgi:transcriptional regulator of aromatic amino acid metabolism